ncbi:MAG: hypothetical protein COV48_09140 [Elusimicrobia bacterium CG11_big_fil_rev_8_21_14_0_20_64_6]|nr:MAG: hypothetical protein COV48_09140 [Elusimicrobia bacterium CG11_big_fil_rev_8_21_14_0_20_64_6]
MNDTTREKLSAYLDGALSEDERRAIEVEISRSEELRLELEALRAVCAAVKGLPKEKLPAGFMTRLAARRAREAKPEREYFILPPSYRPLAFALSTAVIALVVWDRTRPPEQIMAPRAGWDSEVVSVKTAAEAPDSIDLSAQVASQDSRRVIGVEEPLAAAKKEDAAGAKTGVPSTFGKHLNAPGSPLEHPQADGLPSDNQAAALDDLPGAGGAGLAAPAASAEGSNGSFIARNEEERSAINERLYKGFEEEKKRMGIARIADKDAGDERPLASGGREFMALQSSPQAPSLGRAGSVASIRGAAKAKRASAPIVKALTLKSPESLQAAWAAAGLPGEPPAVNFPEQMAIFLAGPNGCGIADVQNRTKFLVVLYKEAGFDDASARVRAVALSSKPVVVKFAP